MPINKQNKEMQEEMLKFKHPLVCTITKDNCDLENQQKKNIRH